MLETPVGPETKPAACACGQTAPVAAAAIAVLEQCEAFVGCAAGTPAYASPSDVLKGGTIGKHIRHTLDHFRAALDGLAPGAVVDYDHRERDVPMETDPSAALEAMASLRARLRGIDTTDLDRPLHVRVMLDACGSEARLLSTLGRELAFAAHHAIHHHAMLGAIAAEFDLPKVPEFGKAPSTIQHERTRA